MPITRYLVSASAIVLGLLGLVSTFAPDHVLRGLGAPISPGHLVMVQALGALYLGFAGLNWMARIRTSRQNSGFMRQSAKVSAAA